MSRRIKRTLAVAAAFVLISGIAACSSSGGRKAEQKQTSTKHLKVAFITHAEAGDTFWDIERKGAKAAAKKGGIKLQYSHSKEGSKQAQLVMQAIDKKVDGIILTLAKPDAMHSAVKKAKKAGIPVFSVNAGEKAAENYDGVLAHFGQNDRVAGEEAGKKLNTLGAKHVVCVIHEQGHVGLENRCKGVEHTVDGKYERAYVNGEDESDVKSTVSSKIQKDSSIDYVLMDGAPFAEMVKKPVKNSSSANLATFDLNGDVIDDIQNGTIKFSLDQQPYLHGYEGVDAVWLYKENRNVLGGGKPVLTGPQIVTKKNAGKIAKYAKNGTR